MKNKVKNNLFPKTLNDLEMFFWTGNGEKEMECSVEDISEEKMVVKTNGHTPKVGTRGSFWRPFFPIYPAVVTETTNNGFVAEFEEFCEDAPEMLKDLVASRNGKVVPNPRRPQFIFRMILKFLFNLEQSLPFIHKRTFELDDFPWSKDFEKEWKTIRAEVENIFKKVDVTDIPLGPDQLPKWHSILIAQKGESSEEAKTLLPVTSKLVDACPTLLNADLSILEPGTEIDYHKANSRTFLRMHLGIIVPKGDVCLHMEGEDLRWEEGKVMIFDDFYPHSAWNKTDEVRVILMVDFLRPMPKWKEKVIRFIHRKTASSLPNIPKEWLN